MTHCPMHVHGFLDSQGKCCSFSKFPMTISSSNFSFFVFWLAACWLQLSSLPQAAPFFNNCCWWFSQVPPGERLFAPSEVWVKANKDKLWEWGFLCICQTDQLMTVLGEWCFEGAPNAFYTLQWVLGSWFSLWLGGCWNVNSGSENVKKPHCSSWDLVIFL